MIRYVGSPSTDTISNLSLKAGSAGRVSRMLWYHNMAVTDKDVCTISEVVAALNTVGVEQLLTYPNFGRTLCAQLLVALRKFCKDVPTPSFVVAYENRDCGCYRKVWVPAERLAAFDNYVKQWQ
jgi:hypothetical protein